MNQCEPCGRRVYGLDCEKCGREFPAECPECRAPFTRVDVYCHQCGRDLSFHNNTHRMRLLFPIGVLAESYEIPADRLGLKLLQNTGPLREATRFFIKQVTEPMLHGQLLGTAVAVAAKQFPRIHRIARTCERILGLKPVNVFVGQGPPSAPTLTVFTYGTEDSACIFISSTLAQQLTDSELRFTLGKEMGHIKSRHVLYLTIAQTIATGLSVFQGVMGQLLVPMLSQVLIPWQRQAEITADRAGLVCCQNLGTAVRTMVKVALGAQGLVDELNLEEYLKQHETLESRFAWSDPQGGHPYLVHRVRYLREFHASSSYRQIFQTAYDPACPKIMCESCRSWEYLSEQNRPLKSATCSDCKGPLGISGVWCPHCHERVPLESDDMTLGRFTCTQCKRGYFEGLLPSDSGPPDSHYDSLGLHSSASEQDVEKAYLALVKPTLRAQVEKTGLHPTEADIRRKIRAHNAYQVLSNRVTRESYNRRLALMRELHRRAAVLGLADAPSRLPLCLQCEAPKFGKYCTLCGWTTPEEKTQGAGEAPVAGGVAGAEVPDPSPPADKVSENAAKIFS